MSIDNVFDSLNNNAGYLEEEGDEDEKDDEKDSFKSDDSYDSHMDVLKDESEDSDPCYGWDELSFNGSLESDDSD